MRGLAIPGSGEVGWQSDAGPSIPDHPAIIPEESQLFSHYQGMMRESPGRSINGSDKTPEPPGVTGSRKTSDPRISSRGWVYKRYRVNSPLCLPHPGTPCTSFALYILLTSTSEAGS